MQVHLEGDHVLLLLLLVLLFLALLQLRGTSELVEVPADGPHMAGDQLRNLKIFQSSEQGLILFLLKILMT